MGFAIDYYQRMAQTPYLQHIEATWGVTPGMMLLLGLLMFVPWSLAYILIFRKCMRDKTYGLPVATLPFAITWEFFFSFGVAGQLPPFVFPLPWGHRIWLIPDAFLLYQMLKFGPQVQKTPFMRRYFRPLFLAIWALEAVGMFYFMRYFNDGYGVASSFLMNVVISVLFVSLFFSRPDMKGLSYAGAWLKMIGTAAGSAFCFFWWPALFAADGQVTIVWRDGPVTTPEPTSYAFLNFMYVTIFLIDCFYIYLLWRRRREIAEGVTSSQFVETPAPVMGLP